MKITQVKAYTLLVPTEMVVASVRHQYPVELCFVVVETDTGLRGHGLTAITNVGVVTTAINEVVAPALNGLDPIATEQTWERMYWLLSPRGQTGIASHAMAAVDTALWDIKGKSLGLPLWKLLGGARSQVQTYTTFGFPEFDREQLVEAARQWVREGHTRLKMVVGHQGLQKRDSGTTMMETIREDARRVRAVRDAVGADIQLYVDANCCLDLGHAIQLARWIDDCGISFFEEPVTQNDPYQMAEFRRVTGMAVAAGQNEGLLFRFRDLIQARAVDFLQPNTVIGGGYSQCIKIAALANAHNLPVTNGGAFPFHNMHLQGGISNGSMVEYHHMAVACCKNLFRNLAEPANGWLKLPDEPGLGFEPDWDAIKTFASHWPNT